MSRLKYQKYRDGAGIHDVKSAASRWDVLEKTIIETCGFPNFRKVLDFGTGYGFFVDKGNERGYEVIGVDVRDEVYKGNPRKFVIGDARRLPFADGSFDIVYCNLTLDDLRTFQGIDVKMKVIPEVRRVLRMGGIFFLDCDFIHSGWFEGFSHLKLCATNGEEAYAKA